MDFAWILEKLDVVAVVVGFNLIMTGAHSILSWVKGKTETKLDDQADDAVVKALEFMKKTIDVVVANKPH